MHALIIANGILPQPDYVRGLVKFAKLIICADGGANHAQMLGIKPHVIIGDFDSILPSTKNFFHDVIQIEDDDPNSTDLEKAIVYCLEQKATSVDIMGALGSRTDHSMGSLGCFKKFGTRIHIRMLDTEGEITLIQKNINLNTREGEKLSLIPVDRCTGVTTKNLKYPLNNGVLELGMQEGISNEATSVQVSIYVESGTLLLYRFHGSAWQFSH
ncbi:MAG: thiamine diphosphokinase [Ignavibacteriales bacterium]|nr:thiamine diphosphokinase [Ignavibacteriales bacterium]